MEALSLVLRYWKYIAAMLMVMAVVTWYNVHVDGLIKEAVDKAVITRDGQWRDQEAKAIAKAKADALVSEADQRATLEKQNQDLQRRLKDAKTIHDRDVADARRGAIQLRFSTSLCPSPTNVPNPTGPGTTPGPAIINLPPEITAGLYSLADDADVVEDELQSCWDKVETYFHPQVKGKP